MIYVPSFLKEHSIKYRNLWNEGEEIVGIYINRKTHPSLFKNNHPMPEPNQEYFKTNYLKDLLQEQSMVNETFQTALNKLKVTMQKQRYQEEKRWEEVSMDLDEIKSDNRRHQQFEEQTKEWITILENNNQELHRIVTENSTLNQEILHQIQSIHQSNGEIMERLMKFSDVNQDLSGKLTELVDKQDAMAGQVATQNEKQGAVIEHLENQEALMEKSSRQLENLRSNLFERTSFIADKIEESYKLTSSIIYKLLTGSEKPIAWMMLNQKKEIPNHDNDRN